MRPTLPRYAQAFTMAVATLAPSAAARAAIAPAPSASSPIGNQGWVTVHVAGSSGASAKPRLTIDGHDAVPDAPIEVQNGTHVVRLETEGHAPIERTIVVEPGDRIEVALDATAPAVAPPPLGGVPPPVKPRGGCAGCGGAGSDESAMLGGGAFALGAIAAMGRRRRR